MIQKNPSILKIFTGLIFILVLLLFFSGCVQNSATRTTAPITVNIHSAYKTMEIRGVNPQPGIIFVVVNMTIENKGDNDYSFNETAVSITDGRLVSEQVYTRLTDNSYWGSLPPNEKRTGDIIFGVKNSTQNFTLKFFYNKGQDYVTQELGIIPMGPDSSIPETSMDTGDSMQVSADTQPINVTINSAFKTMEIRGETPYSGQIFVVTNMTVENKGYKNYSFNENAVNITGGSPLTHKLYSKLNNPLYWSSILPQEKKTGEVVFGVNKSMQILTITFRYNMRKDSFTQEIGNIPVVKDYSSSLFPPGVFESQNFTYVVENLNTPIKAAEYTKEKFRFHDRGTCYGQTPNQFFMEGAGDCLSYANFFSYVLAQHGYDVKKVSFKYHAQGVSLGHVVTLFTDSDGQLKYATTPDLRVFRNVSSVDDLIVQEKKRLGIYQLDIKNGVENIKIIPVEDTNSCHY